jgi:hypothetical protein
MVSRKANATAPIRQAETGAVRKMLVRTEDRFALHPEMLVADTGYGSADMLGWLVEEQDIELHIPVFDKSERKDGAFPATDFVYDHGADEYRCPGGRVLKPYWRNISKGRPEFGKDGFKKYFARKQDCAACMLKPRCTPNQATRKISRSRYESARQKARDIARTDGYVASSYARKRCCSRTSNASSASTASASADPTAQRTSSTSRQPSRTSANSRSSSQCRCKNNRRPY